jgi:hypothetical protein
MGQANETDRGRLTGRHHRWLCRRTGREGHYIVFAEVLVWSVSQSIIVHMRSVDRVFLPYEEEGKRVKCGLDFDVTEGEQRG